MALIHICPAEITALLTVLAVVGPLVKARRSQAFTLMLSVKRALTTGMLTYGEGRFTILESSEDRASELLEQALAQAERRGADRRKRAQHLRNYGGRR